MGPDRVIFAGRKGTIETIDFQVKGPTRRGKELGLTAGGAGRYVVVRHDDGTLTTYMHLVENSTNRLRERQEVRRGALLGQVDQTPPGGTTGPHLHFEYRDANGQTVDPEECVVEIGSVTIDQGISVKINEGETVQLTATVLDLDGKKLKDVLPLIWTSSDEERVPVDDNGLVTSVVTGILTEISAAVQVQAGLKFDLASIFVSSRVDAVEVTPANPTIGAGETIQLTAELVDAGGNMITGDFPDATVTWFSRDTDVATVDGNGLVTGVGPGSTAVSADVVSAGTGRLGETTVTVITVSPPVTFTITPFVTGGPFGGFQSTPGTGFQTTITISFSGPVSSVTITALDPDFGGNRMRALNAGGTLVDEAFFAGDNTPGEFTRSTATVSGSGIVTVLLIPDPLDYIAYSGLQFTPDTGN